MKVIKKIFITLLIVMLLCGYMPKFDTYKTSAATNNTCAEIIIESSTNRILHQANAYDKKFMASTTKILTAITIIENCNLDEVVTVSEETVGIEGSSIYLEVGEKLSIRHLLYGLMLRSGNDCAETLAVFCSGNISNFAQLMNQTARKIGAKSSNFTNPHGLHDDNHYTTAYDLALISSYAMKNDDFRQIVGTKSIKIPFTTRSYDRLLINKNKMLKEFAGSNGIKTGYTKRAGRCLVSSCCRNGMELICVVLNCPPMFERSKSLLNDCFNRYKNYKIIESDNVLKFVNVNNSNQTCAVGVKNDIILPLTKYEKDNLKIEFDCPNQLDKPIKKDKLIGFVKIYCKNSLIFQEKIYTIVSVN